ncbi:MAG: transporter sugar permease [Frondihabitans sp.]|nr:transporter sugar permease [Frondihabitans sp.]
MTTAQRALRSVRASRVARRPRRGSGRQNRAAWILLGPFAVLFLLFTAIPVVASLGISLTDLQGADLRTPFDVDFTGLKNYVSLFQDPGFIQSIGNTFVFVLVGVPLTTAIGFALAVVLNSAIRRMRPFFRALFYAPVVANVVSIALIWQYAFNQDGTVNKALAMIGLAGPDWLGDTHFAMPVVIALGVWRNFGTAMLLFLAGLQAVPQDVHEAASLDGAGWWRRLFSVTLPLLLPTVLLVSVLLTVFFLQVFDEPYLLTNGGPLGSTESMALYTYQQFGFGRFGVSSAASFVMLVLVAVVSFIQFKILRPRT